jgi:hypothetical protein
MLEQPFRRANFLIKLILLLVILKIYFTHMINMQKRHVRIFLFKHKEDSVNQVTNFRKEVIVRNFRNPHSGGVIRIINRLTKYAVASREAVPISLKSDVCTKRHLS